MAKTGPKSKSSVHSAPGVIPPEDAKALKKELKKKTQGLEIDDFGAIASRAALKNQPPAAKSKTSIPKLDKAAVKPKSRKTVDPNSEEGATGDGKLLDDLTWVYLKLGGRSKLLQLMKKDEKLRTHFLRLMLTLEVKKELEGNKGNGRGKGEFGADGKRQKRNFFMIFRGLHETAEKKLVDGLASGKIGPDAIESILNPQQDDYSKPLPEGPISYDDIPFLGSDDDEVSEEELERRMKEAQAELGDMSEELLEEAL